MDDFETYRSLLFAIAYRMLGSVMEAEDVVQDAYLRWQAVPREMVREPKAFLSTVVTRLCLDQLKSARAQRETYIGPWLPEPLLTDGLAAGASPAERVTLQESVSMAFLVLLESLTPAERAVFLLHEVFEYPFAEVATSVGRPETTCRQLFRRAKQHLVERRPRFAPAPEAQRRLTEGFWRACTRGDLDGLKVLLADDVTVWSDGGGKATAARNPIHGRDAVARFLVGIARKAPVDVRVERAEINGSLAFVVRIGSALHSVFTFESDGQHIRALRVVLNPDKLAHLGTALGSD